MMELLPKENQSLATAVFITFVSAASAIALPAAGLIFKIKIFNEEWLFLGEKMTQYDAFLLISAFMILLLIITLSLVPAVMKKAIWIPINRS